MKDRRIEKMTSAYGADPARWPSAARPEGGKILLSCTEASSQCAEARMVDKALDALPRPAPASHNLRAAILAMPARVPQKSRRTFWRRLRNWRPFGAVRGSAAPQVGGLILACLLGLFMGYSDIFISPWGHSDLTEITLGLDTPQGLASLEGIAEK